MNQEKKTRTAHRQISIAKFQRLETMQDVAMALFGKPSALATWPSYGMNAAMTENEHEHDGPVGVVEPLTGMDAPRQVIRYERRNGRIFATWIAPSGAITSGEVPLFQEGDGFYDVFGQFLGDS